MSDFAILAPVPMEHLRSGYELAPNVEHVAYGTNKWEWLRDVEIDRAGMPIPMLLYASHEGDDADPTCNVAWIGWLVGSSESEREVKDHRPPSTQTDGKWGAFWLVKGLKPLPKADQLPISKIQTTKGGWRKEAPPRGPERVELPSTLSPLFDRFGA